MENHKLVPLNTKQKVSKFLGEYFRKKMIMYKVFEEKSMNLSKSEVCLLFIIKSIEAFFKFSRTKPLELFEFF